jgi:hypothetical protein
VRPEVLPTIALPSELDRVLRDWKRLAGEMFGPGRALHQRRRERAAGAPAGPQPRRAGRVYRGQGGGLLSCVRWRMPTADSVGYIIGAYGYGDDPADQGSSR